MRELRPASSGTTEIRLIFAFDPRREAIVLVAGDKSGAWKQWYREAIPLADDRYTAYLAQLNDKKDGDPDKPAQGRPPADGNRRRHAAKEER